MVSRLLSVARSAYRTLSLSSATRVTSAQVSDSIEKIMATNGPRKRKRRLRHPGTGDEAKLSEPTLQ